MRAKRCCSQAMKRPWFVLPLGRSPKRAMTRLSRRSWAVDANVAASAVDAQSAAAIGAATPNTAATRRASARRRTPNQRAVIEILARLQKDPSADPRS
jgi:hypothetical protein